jgi:hypothetical protein
MLPARPLSRQIPHMCGVLPSVLRCALVRRVRWCSLEQKISPWFGELFMWVVIQELARRGTNNHEYSETLDCSDLARDISHTLKSLLHFFRRGNAQNHQTCP